MFSSLKCIKINNFNGFDKNDFIAFEKYFKHPSTSTILILIANTEADDFLKKKIKNTFDLLSKLSKDVIQIHQFNRQYENNYRTLIMSKLKTKDYEFSPDLIEYIISITNNREGDIDSLITRINEICPPPALLTISLIQDNSQIDKQPNIFEFIGNLFDKDCEKTLLTFHQLLNYDENLFTLIFWIRRNIVTYWKIKALLSKGVSQKGLYSNFTQPPFILNKMIKQAESFSFSELESMLGSIKQIDYFLKSDEPFFSNIRFEQFIIKFTSKSVSR